MNFMAHFTMGNEGHYITMLPADWSISASHDPLPSSWKDAMESVYTGDRLWSHKQHEGKRMQTTRSSGQKNGQGLGYISPPPMPCHYSKLTGTLSGCFSLILADSADLTSGAKIKMEKQVHSMLNYKASNCISVAHCWDPLQIMWYLPCLLYCKPKEEGFTQTNKNNHTSATKVRNTDGHWDL